MATLAPICQEILGIQKALVATDSESPQALALARIRSLLAKIDRGVAVGGVDFLLAVSGVPVRSAGRQRRAVIAHAVQPPPEQLVERVRIDLPEVRESEPEPTGGR
jgi:hypothetical protein